VTPGKDPVTHGKDRLINNQDTRYKKQKIKEKNKKMKKLLFTLIACVLCLGMVGGAFAYFTDVETSQDNSLQAGTLNMQIKDADEPYGDTPVSATFVSPSNWAPGDEFVTAPVTFKNVGTIEIRYIFGRFCGLHQEDGANPDPEGAGSPNNIANYIVLVSYLEKATGSADFYEEEFDEGNANAYLEYWGFPQVGYITLADLVAANPAGESVKTGLWFFDGGNDPTIPPLPVGGTAQIKFKFKLLESTNNNYQGDIASFRVDFVAAQTQVDLDASITEPVGPAYIP
jgi:predicted ribosomally synthesized peptide with SipW-like signal peptide